MSPIVAWNPQLPGEPFVVLLFALFSLLAIFGAIRVVTASDPFISALSLLFNFVSLGALYLLLGQDFVAISQILVYAGAVVVLFLFVIAYLGDRRELADDGHRAPLLRPFGVLGAVALALALVTIVAKAKLPSPVHPPKTDAGFAFGSAQAIGESFLTKYILIFEATSVVLLVAAIGGIVLGLTGRARHDRLRKLMQTRSADQQKRLHDVRDRELRDERSAEQFDKEVRG
jgi:NADH-quinone oxidoreductase subunit J